MVRRSLKIMPKRSHGIISRGGLSCGAFHDLRFDADDTGDDASLAGRAAPGGSGTTLTGTSPANTPVRIC